MSFQLLKEKSGPCLYLLNEGKLRPFKKDMMPFWGKQKFIHSCLVCCYCGGFFGSWTLIHYLCLSLFGPTPGVDYDFNDVVLD